MQPHRALEAVKIFCGMMPCRAGQWPVIAVGATKAGLLVAASAYASEQTDSQVTPAMLRSLRQDDAIGQLSGSHSAVGHGQMLMLGHHSVGDMLGGALFCVASRGLMVADGKALTGIVRGYRPAGNLVRVGPLRVPCAGFGCGACDAGSLHKPQATMHEVKLTDDLLQGISCWDD